MKHLFIINPKSGVKDVVSIIEAELKEVFKDEDYEIHVTTKRDDGYDFVKEYLTNHQDDVVRIYACGGDGTMNEVANGMYGFSNAELAIYPSGSGNDFLKYYGPNAATSFKSFANLKNGISKPIDVIKTNERLAVNEINIGFDANVVVKQAKIKKWPLVSGKFAYDIGVLSAFLQKIDSYYKITVDDEVIYEGVAVLGALMNGCCYGGGYYPAPYAKVDDGLINLCMIKDVKRRVFLGLVNDYKKGKHIYPESKAYPYVLTAVGKKIRIEIDCDWPYSVDGEIYYTKDLVVEAIPNAIKIVLPLEIINNKLEEK